MRQAIGALLCFATGALFVLGAVPLFNYGEVGRRVWPHVEAVVASIATTIGIAPWMAMWLLGFFAIGGPLAVVWLIAGRGVNRITWFLSGLIAGVLWWLFGPALPIG